MDLDPDRLIPALIGRSIVSGDVGESGFHLDLDDGRTLVFTGVFAIGLLDSVEQTLQ